MLIFSQIGVAAAAPVLQDRNQFRGFYRGIVGYDLYGPGIARIILQYSWTQVTIITEANSLFLPVSNRSVLYIA